MTATEMLERTVSARRMKDGRQLGGDERFRPEHVEPRLRAVVGRALFDPATGCL